MSGLMALVAVFLVVISFNYAKNNLSFESANKKASDLSFDANSDWDNDGLNNREWNSEEQNNGKESLGAPNPKKRDTEGEGFWEGEEVASAHDPLILAPN